MVLSSILKYDLESQKIKIKYLTEALGSKIQKMEKTTILENRLI